MDEYVRSDIFDERLKRVDDENIRQNRRIDKLEGTIEKIGELASSVQLLAQNMAQMKDELTRQGDRLKDIEAEPGEKWKKLTWLIITAVAGAAVGYILSKIGL